MVRRFQNSAIAADIKREYLKEHLENARRLIERWTSELHATAPLEPKDGVFGWQLLYQPETERDPDDNHMLRRHLRSRVLWTHHSDWERKIEHAWQLAKSVKGQASAEYQERSSKARWHYSGLYLDTALWKGFDLASGQRIEKWYKVPDDGQGLSYGAYKIELSAASAKERSKIEEEHRAFVSGIARFTSMKELATIWGEVLGLERRMVEIACKVLKANDLLYPCRFCRHLWE